MVKNFFIKMESNSLEKKCLNEMIEMLGSLASLDFSKRLDCNYEDESVNVLAYGLNMIGEELENNVIRRTDLEELNENLERFAYSIAHDIRSPLNSAMGLLDLIEDRAQKYESDGLKYELKLLRKIHQNMHGLVEGVLENSRSLIRNSKRNIIHLTTFFDELLLDFGMNPNLVIKLNFNGLENIRFNTIAFKQIFYNLVSNALRYSCQEVTVIAINMCETEDKWMIQFADNGKGIDSSIEDRIFELSESLDQGQKDSYGIGLNIVKRIVEQNNGSIELDQNASEGAKFNLVFYKTQLNLV
jgi:signal transduction histidine kinase